MKLKLKTIEQIKKENPKHMMVHGDIHFSHVGIYIDEDMYDYFGKEIEVQDEIFKYKECIYYTDINDGWDFLKEWFELDFIKEEEMKL
jgi:hypothetical protein